MDEWDLAIASWCDISTFCRDNARSVSLVAGLTKMEDVMQLQGVIACNI